MLQLMFTQVRDACEFLPNPEPYNVWGRMTGNIQLQFSRNNQDYHDNTSNFAYQ